MTNPGRLSFPLPSSDFVAAAGLAALLLVPLSAVWLQSPDMHHGWAAGLLMIYLWWERWSERPLPIDRTPSRMAGWMLVIGFGLLALPLRLLLAPFPLWPTIVWAYVILLLAAGTLAIWFRSGWSGVRWFLAPCLILVSALPWPSLIEQRVILPMREGMAALAAELSNFWGKPALAMGTSVRLPADWVGLDEACGGIRSLHACVMIALFFGEWFRFGIRRRLVLLALGICAAFLGNFSRVLFLSLTAGSGGSASVHELHDLAGWVSLTGSLVITALVACRWAGWRWPAMNVSVGLRPAPTINAAAWFCWLVAFIALDEGMTRWWFSGGLDDRKNIPQWTVTLPENHWSFVPEPLAELSAEILRPDVYRAGRWKGDGNLVYASYYVEWQRGQVARYLPFAHNPTVCLPLAGCELVRPLGSFTVSWRGLKIPFQAYQFSRMGEDLWVMFTIWDPTKGEAMAQYSGGETLFGSVGNRWAEVTEKRENQPAQMLTLAISGVEKIEIKKMQDAINRLIVD
jgi:exosortase